jgi:hypothetical protein
MGIRILIGLIVALSGRQDSVSFPVVRAKDEFLTLIPHVKGYCGAIRGDVEAFRRAVLPYGPMDLTVSKGTTEEAESLRNLYLGIAGAACEIDAQALAKSFHCGISCTADRKTELLAKLGPIKEVVRDFASLKGIELVSQWGIVGEYRVDNIFAMMDQVKETKPSLLMGFVPSEIWTDIGADLKAYLKRKNVSEKRFDSMLQKVKALSLAAVVREPEGTRVVRVGIADNESGLLFLNTGTAMPLVGQRTHGGRRYVVVQELEKKLVFYETD